MLSTVSLSRYAVYLCMFLYRALFLPNRHHAVIRKTDGMYWPSKLTWHDMSPASSALSESVFLIHFLMHVPTFLFSSHMTPSIFHSRLKTHVYFFTNPFRQRLLVPSGLTARIIGLFVGFFKFYCAMQVVPYRLSSDSKTRDFEWSWIAILR